MPYGFALTCESWRDVNPAGFDFRLVGTEGFRADMLHLHFHVLHECCQSGRKALVAHVHWNRAGERLACSNIELGAVHGAGYDLAVEGAHFQRGIHMSAAPLDGVISSVAITDDDLVPIELDGLHPPGRDLIGADCGDELVTHGPLPLAGVAAGCPGR